MFYKKSYFFGPISESFSNAVEIKTGQVDPISDECPSAVHRSCPAKGVRNHLGQDFLHDLNVTFLLVTY